MFSLKSHYLCISNKEITQIPKSESKKFSIMCTFKEKKHGSKYFYRSIAPGKGFDGFSSLEDLH
jgi:hypothetical protein